MKDRISKFLVAENISPTEFADKIGVQRSSISHVITGRNNPSASFIQKMLSAYPNLNPRWLLLGEGKMSVGKEPPTELSLFDNAPLNFDKQQKTEKSKSNSYSAENLQTKSETTINEVNKIENFASKTELKDEKIADILPIITENKEIERVIIFYKDKTFSAYLHSV